MPAAWRVLYRRGVAWVHVEMPDTYGVEKDRYNRVQFGPVQTTALRLEVSLQPTFSAGLQEWRVR